MRRVDEHFILHRSRSQVFTKYAPGDVPYIASGLFDNGVMGFVKPLPGDRVFQFRGIAVSAFCEATIQVPPFIGYGCAGTSIVALEPRTPMTAGQLAYAATYINHAMRWRFSWYWRLTPPRLARLMMPDTISDKISFNIGSLIPRLSKPEPTGQKPPMKRFALGGIFTLDAGDYHNVGTLPRGRVPIISCGDEGNGVCGYFDVKHVHSHCMTIAFNGATLAAKYHPYEFAAKDDVAVCTPKTPLRLTTILFVQVMLKREQWRFSYYRKCYKEKLERVTVPLPVANGVIDEDAIESLMRSTPYWQFLDSQLHAPGAAARLHP